MIHEPENIFDARKRGLHRRCGWACGTAGLQVAGVVERLGCSHVGELGGAGDCVVSGVAGIAAGEEGVGGNKKQQIPPRDTVRGAENAHPAAAGFGSDPGTPVESIGLPKPEMTAWKLAASQEHGEAKGKRTTDPSSGEKWPLSG